MGLAVLVLGLAVFIGPHVLVSLRDTRARIVARLGEGAYKGLFSLVSIVGIVLIAYGFAGYRAGGLIDIWHPPTFMRHVTVALMLPSIILVVAAYIPGHIKKTLKHPMLVGARLWAFAHLLSNGVRG